MGQAQFWGEKDQLIVKDDVQIYNPWGPRPLFHPAHLSLYSLETFEESQRRQRGADLGHGIDEPRLRDTQGLAEEPR